MDLSIVSPVYNEGENVKRLYAGLMEVLLPLGISFEIVFVDDGSQDESLQILKKLHDEDPRVKIVSLSRNFGLQVALSAGLDATQGKIVITMDSDLQDEPSYILKLIEKWKEGYECVYAIRQKRHETFLRTFFFESFYKVFNYLSEVKIPANAGDFCLMDRKIVDALKLLPERKRFIRGLRMWVGCRHTGIPQDRPARPKETSIKQGFKKLFNMGFDGVFSFSYVPLRLAIVMGILSSIFGFILGLKVLYEKFFTTKPIVGWTSLMVTIIFFSGIILLFLGIIGEYLCRIYDETKARPLYFVKEKIGF